jgi:hypothetical protein
MQRIEKELINDGELLKETPYVGEKKEGIEITTDIKKDKIARKSLYKDDIKIIDLIYDLKRERVFSIEYYDEENCKIYISYFENGNINMYYMFDKKIIYFYNIDGKFNRVSGVDSSNVELISDPKNIINEPWYHYNKYIKNIF